MTKTLLIKVWDSHYLVVKVLRVFFAITIAGVLIWNSPFIAEEKRLTNVLKNKQIEALKSAGDIPAPSHDELERRQKKREAVQSFFKIGLLSLPYLLLWIFVIAPILNKFIFKRIRISVVMRKE